MTAPSITSARVQADMEQQRARLRRTLQAFDATTEAETPEEVRKIREDWRRDMRAMGGATPGEQ